MKTETITLIIGKRRLNFYGHLNRIDDDKFNRQILNIIKDSYHYEQLATAANALVPGSTPEFIASVTRLTLNDLAGLKLFRPVITSVVDGAVK